MSKKEPHQTGTPSEAPDITGLLQEWGGREKQVLDRLFPLIYTQLKCIAKLKMLNDQPSPSLGGATELVNEAYLQLLRSNQDLSFLNRNQFFVFAGRLMRNILLDDVRRRLSLKRGGGKVVNLAEETIILSEQTPMTLPAMLALDGALGELEAKDPKLCRLVELRFFVGLTNQEIADALGISTSTVQREWQTAKRWLAREMKIESRSR